MTHATQTLAAIAMAISLSLGIALVMERALFRTLLKLMFVLPRRIDYCLAEARLHLRHLRRAGL